MSERKGATFVPEPGLSDEERGKGRKASEGDHLEDDLGGMPQKPLGPQANLDLDDCGSHTIARR